MKLTLDAMKQMAQIMPGNNMVCRVNEREIRCEYYTDDVPKLINFSQEEFLNIEDLFQLIFEEDQLIIAEKMRKCFITENKRKSDFLFRLVHKDDGFIWIHMAASVVAKEENDILVVGSLVDVTKEMLNSYALMEASSRCVCVIEKATKRFLYANTPFYKLIDSSPAQAMGKHCYELLCKTMEMKTNDNCLCYSSINVEEPILSYNPEKKLYLTMTGSEILWGEHEAYVFYLTDITKDKEKDAMLEDSVKRFNVALDNSDLMIWEYDIVNNRCINSEKAGRDYDIPLIIENYPESLFETGYTPPETVEQIRDVKRRLLNGETGFSVERRTVDKFGKSNWQKVDYTLECDENGKPVRAIVCGLDITAQKELEQKYNEQMEYRNNLAKKALFSVRFDLDNDTILDYTCNEPVLEDIQKKASSASDFIERFFKTSVFNADSEMSKERLSIPALKEDFRLGQRQYQAMYESSMLNKFLEMNMSMHQNPENNHLEAFLLITDISNNEFLHDPVTGLYNRQKSYLECSRILSEHPNDVMVMVHFDIQRFRLYNSFFGEKEGDNLLRYIANMFRTLFDTHEYGVYGRIEADVFLLCFPFTEDVIAWNQRYIHQYLTKYREDFQVLGNCGVYIINNRTLTAEAMFNRATIAAKNNPNKQLNPIYYFNDEMELRLVGEQNIIQEMRRAIAEEQFHVYLQPKYKLVTGEAFGAEALVRWIHPEQGIISPGDFIPIFETNGFITTLDRYMWEHVCILLRKWLDEGLEPAPISVNMSRVSMYSPQTVSFLVELVEKYEIKPYLLNLELTESAYMDDPEEMKKRLIELRNYGFKIMMDDFGSGYSSLNTLRDIPVDYLKVDRVFLASVDQDKRSRMVLASVVHMAARMGIPVITEGVETKAQKEFLASIGCDYVQGFLYAKPMPVAEYEQGYLFKQEIYEEEETGEEVDTSNILMSMDTEVQHFSNLLPFALAFVEYIGQTFTYLSGNDKFVEVFGLHKDVMDMEELIAHHLSEGDYENLQSTYKSVAETAKSKECYITWIMGDGTDVRYMVRVQYIGASFYSKILSTTFIDLSRQQHAIKREQRLSRCLELMTNDENVELNLEKVVKHVNHQYLAERAYIFEFDWKNNLMSNTYEYVAEGVSKEKENLQNLPIGMIDYWMKSFRNSQAVFLDDLDAIKDHPERREEYEVLKPQGIKQLMVIPIIKNEQLYGYIGVDNPKVQSYDKDFLTSVAHILSQEFYSREQHDKLVEMSLRDPLTHLNNRHSYNMHVDAYQANNGEGVGVIFADVNGLKYMNDNYGHREGDRLICLAAEVLIQYFSFEKCYRISGDEFVVIDEDINKCEFFEKAEHMKQSVLDQYGSVFSIGFTWDDYKVDIQQMVADAEALMYINKEQYYEDNPLKKRTQMEELIKS